MSQPSPAQQAIAWLEQQVTDLNGIRNATPRDPSFKNWRQATLTIMQRIWPNDQERQERFRRIPFSPADPRADARTIREWYSRGCQEASRVLAGFISDVQAQGVPVQAADVATRPTSAEFTVDFPTLDLPAGDLRTSTPAAEEADDMLQLGPSSGSATTIPPTLQQPTPQPRTPVPGTYATFRPGRPNPLAPAAPPHAQAPPPAAPTAAPPPSFHAPAPAPAPQAPPLHAAQPAASRPHSVQPAPPQASSPGPDPRQPKKGMGARLRDLLGFAQLSAKAFTGLTREEPTPRPAPPSSFEIQPVGDEVTPPRAPAPPPVVSQAPPVATPPPASLPPAPPVEEMREPGASVVMSRPTTLRGNIEKVSIESLISPEFRNAEDTASTPPSPLPPPWALAADPLDVPYLRPVSGTMNAAPAAPESPVVNQPTPVLDAVAQSLTDALAMPPAPAPVASAPEALTQPAQPPVIEPAPPVASEPAPPVAPAATVAPVEAVAPPPPIAPPAPTVLPAASSGAFPLPTPSGPMPAPPVVSADPTPSGRITAPPTSDSYTGSPSTIIPLPPFAKMPSEPAGAGEKPSRTKRDSTPKVLPFSKRPVPEPVEAEIEDVIEELPDGAPVDPEEFAQATEDFIRTSPVLGATGRKVKRGDYDERKRETRETREARDTRETRDPGSYDDPDAIAVIGMLDDLSGLGVPNARHKEARARLEDLAKRIEKGELDWAALRKAVWFAMEYPELARRLMPILLPWIDRAA